MRRLTLVGVCLCLLLAATNPIAQEDPAIEQAKEKAKAAWTKADLAKGELVIAEGEKGQAYWELSTLEWKRDRKPLLEELSKVERNMQAMMRMEHTLEERDAMGQKYAKALAALEEFDTYYADEFRAAWKLMGAAYEWEDARDFEEIAEADDIRRLNQLCLAFAPLHWVQRNVELEQATREDLTRQLGFVECETMLALYYRAQSSAAALNELLKKDPQPSREELEDARNAHQELIESIQDLRVERDAALNRTQFMKVVLEGAIEEYSNALNQPVPEDPDVDTLPHGKVYYIGYGKKNEPAETTPIVVANLETTVHCAELAALKGVKKLKVQFAPCEFVEVGDKRHELLAAGIKAIGAHTGLETLTLELPFECKADDCRALSKLESLRNLDVSSSSITDEQLQAFRGLNKVEKLDLSGCLLLGTNTVDVLDHMKALKRVDLTLCIGIPRWARALVAHRNPEAKVLPDGNFPIFAEE